MIDGIYGTVVDRLDGVIHGAGVVEDKLIGRQDGGTSVATGAAPKWTARLCPAAFSRPDLLKFRSSSSSVSCQLWQPVQVMHEPQMSSLKLAVLLDRDWPGHVVPSTGDRGMRAWSPMNCGGSNSVSLVPIDVGLPSS